MLIETLSIQKINPAPYNPRKITDEAMKRLERSITEFDLVEPLVVNKQTGYTLVSGHQRLKVLEKQGKKDVECVIVDLPSSHEKALNIALNNPATAGEYDFSKLADLLAEIDTGEFDVSALTGFDPAELERIANWTPGNDAEETEATPEPPAVAISQTGDLWELGKHRLLCGDSTKAEDVARVMNGKKALVMLTDPPYGVALDQGWRDRIGINRMGCAQGDAIHSDEGFGWLPALKYGGAPVAYVWHAGVYAREVQDGLEAAGFKIRQQIVWVKTMAVLSRSAYQWKHEPCWYAVADGQSAPWRAGRDQTTVWEAASPKHIMSGSDEKKEDHPTQKPVKLFEIPIKNHTRNGEIIYDPFLGSGTTLIAAEKLGRRCYAMEIEPRYVDVAVKRFINFAPNKEVKCSRSEAVKQIRKDMAK